MRKSKISAEEAHAAEKAAAERKETRNTGFSMMHTRDKGYHVLSNGVSIIWPTRREGADYEAIVRVDEGKFVLEIDGKKTVFDTDEFRQYLRWA